MKTRNNNYVQVKKESMKTFKLKKNIYLFFLIPFTILFFSGCQFIKESFGKEYRIIDDFFDQLEADMIYTIEEYCREYEIPKDEQEEINNRLIAELNVSKEELKYAVKNFEDLKESMGVTISTEVYLEKTLLEARNEIDQVLKEGTDGKISLKKTEVKRNLPESIWHFIRNNWLICFIILCVLSSGSEYISEKISKKKKENSSESQTP